MPSADRITERSLQDEPLKETDSPSGLGSAPETTDKRYQEEVPMPLLARRRAEARFKEATVVHENSMAHMKAELHEIERRTVKQQTWMKHVDEQVLQVELTKARYQVRLDGARKRIETLGKDLSKSYEHMGGLLEDRLEVEDLGARNDALVSTFSTCHSLMSTILRTSLTTRRTYFF
jgi:hypothetical protein